MIERTTNSLISSLSHNLLKDKPNPNQTLVDNASKNLPLSFGFNRVYGIGDWERGRSSGGSAVLGDGGKYVAKVSLGTISRNPMEWAREIERSISHFSDVSPKTMVIIAADGEGNIKPVLIQETVHGKPLCNSDINELFKLKTLKGIKNVLQYVRTWYNMNNSFDLCGQMTQKGFIGKVIKEIPFFSDNMMLGNDGTVHLVDNSMGLRTKQYTIKNRIKTEMRKAVFGFQSVLIDSLIIAKKVYNFTKGTNEENLIQIEEMGHSSSY